MQYHCFVRYWAFMKTRNRKKYYGIIIIISMNIFTMKHILTDLYWAQ